MQNAAQWPKGTFPTYDAFVMEVGVRKDHAGSWQSYRRLQDDSDHTVAEKMSNSGGMEEGAWALLSEAVRAEALLQLLVSLSNRPDLQESLRSAEKAPEDLIEELSANTVKQLKLTLDKVAKDFVRETIEQVHGGLRS